MLAARGLGVRAVGARLVHRVLPPAVTGAVVMLIGFNLAPVAAGTYWPQDQWTALATLLFTGFALVALRGFWNRIAIFLGLVFGYALTWILDRVLGRIHSADPTGKVTDHWRLDLSGVAKADWFGLPTLHAPSFELSAVLVALPVVIALIAENAGHVKRARLPHAWILMLGIFPRHDSPCNDMRIRYEDISQKIARLADSDAVYFLDIGTEFLKADGSLRIELMPDQLHLNEAGYRVWAGAMEPTVRRLLDEP